MRLANVDNGIENYEGHDRFGLHSNNANTFIVEICDAADVR
jgi:hypothetical protein